MIQVLHWSQLVILKLLQLKIHLKLRIKKILLVTTMLWLRLAQIPLDLILHMICICSLINPQDQDLMIFLEIKQMDMNHLLEIWKVGL
jgi:hypothetical protein